MCNPSAEKRGPRLGEVYRCGCAPDPHDVGGLILFLYGVVPTLQPAPFGRV